MFCFFFQTEHNFEKTKSFVSGANVPEEELQNDYWLNKAKHFVENQLNKPNNVTKAKNIIFFIGDGMSIPTIAATRVFMGGESEQLSFEKFPATGMVKTYCIDQIVADSACTSTAYLNGIKGNVGTVGVDANVRRSDCEAGLNPDYHSSSIAKWAQDANKVAGLVTNTRVTHASPSGVYAHSANRDWEYDVTVNNRCPDANIPDIADQLINNDVGSKLRVIMGGGRSYFLDESIEDEENVKGIRKDGKNLINDWKTRSDNREYVWDRSGLMSVNVSNIDYLLGIFDSDHMPYHHLTTDTKPSLTEMTGKAIEILSKHEEGYFLFVEGGQIDFAHHSTYAKVSFDETSELSKAVEHAREITSEEDTLIVVSSDHSHTLQYSGYAPRGNNIIGTAGSAIDNKPYLTISYANGGGFHNYFKDGERIDPSTVLTAAEKNRHPSTVPLSTETHGGDDVGVFASGPYSHLFTGTYEQHVLPHLMAYAACIGDGLTACDDN